MNHHCQSYSPRAERLQILNAILGTPRKWLVDRFSDAELQRIEDEAVAIGRELEAESRCTDCGGKVSRFHMSVDQRIATELKDLWA